MSSCGGQFASCTQSLIGIRDFGLLFQRLSYSMVKHSGSGLQWINYVCPLLEEGQFTVTITLMNVETQEFKTDRTSFRTWAGNACTHTLKKRC